MTPVELNFYVPCYIYLYLKKTYSFSKEDLLDLTLPEARDLRYAFRYRNIPAFVSEPVLLNKESFALIRLKVPFSQAYKYRGVVAHRNHVVKHATIFFYEFWMSAIAYTDAIIDYRSQKEGGTKYRKEALDMFLQKYEITEEVYPFHNAYRLINRWLKWRKEVNKHYEKLDDYSFNIFDSEPSDTGGSAQLDIRFPS
ncbi:MAG: hypothetical protein AAFP83_17415 [Bacteroidota bacterium]